MLVAQGLTTVQIAQATGLAEATVRAARGQIRRRLATPPSLSLSEHLGRLVESSGDPVLNRRRYIELREAIGEFREVIERTRRRALDVRRQVVDLRTPAGTEAARQARLLEVAASAMADTYEDVVGRIRST